MLNLKWGKEVAPIEAILSTSRSKSYDEIMNLWGEFDKNTGDVDDQFKGLIPPEIQLQDLEGGMKGGHIAAEAGVDNL